MIVSNPNILNGKPIVRGTRISVALILQCVASGMTIEDILKGYPTLTRQGVKAALDFASRQFQGEEVRVSSDMEKKSRTHLYSKGLYSFLFFLLILNVLLVVEPGTSRASGPERLRSYYIGTLDNRLPIQMELIFENGSVHGWYYYVKSGNALGLAGKIGQDQEISLDETDETGQKTGTFNGHFTLYRHTFTGTWLSPDHKRSFPFRLTKVAEYTSLSARIERFLTFGILEASDTVTAYPYYPFYLKMEYPIFVSPTSGVQKINTIISNHAQREFHTIESAISRNRTRQGEFWIDRSTEWYDDYYYSIKYYSEDFVSLFVVRENYSGGAHIITDYQPAHYWIKDEEPDSVTLSDLFLPGSPYLEELSNYCINDLREQGASNVVNGEVLNFNEDDLSDFSVSPRGIEFCFERYSLGSYAEGEFFVTVPFKSLERIFNPEGPLKKIVGSKLESGRTKGAR